MGLNEKLGADITAAMKAKDAPRLSALRMLKAAVMNEAVVKGHDLDDGEFVTVVSKLTKQRRDAAEQYEGAGRVDLATRERDEIPVLDQYLPPAASAAEIEAAVAAAVAATGASSVKDIGLVMKAARATLAATGKYIDGKAVNEAARRALA